MKRRLLAVLLTLCMLVGLLPTTVLAESGDSYCWNVATIEPNGSGYALSPATGNVNTEDNVTVSVSEDQTDWTPIDASSNGKNTERYIKISPADGYYVQYLVVACNDNRNGNSDGLNCQSVGKGSAYLADFDAAQGDIILDTAAKGFYHQGKGAPYHILIQLAEKPNPVYVAYEAGEAASAFNETTPIVNTTVEGPDKLTSVPNVAYKYAYNGTTPEHTVLAPSKDKVVIGDELYTFTGWKATYYAEVTSDADTYPTFGGDLSDTYKNPTFSAGNLVELNTHVKLVAQWDVTDQLPNCTITINYQDAVGTTLQDRYSDTQEYGYNYSFDVSSDATGDIPFIIEKTETVDDGEKSVQYVFDHFTDDSDGLSGELTKDIEITAVYLRDANNNDIPDAYEATVTYKVVNGTWSDETVADKTANFILKTFNHTTNTWDSVNPTLGNTIPTDMKPDSTHVAPGVWDTVPESTTLVTGDAIYTYTFNTLVNSALTVEKTLVKVNGTDYTTGSKVKVGDVLTYEIKVTNTGNVSLSDVTVTDTFTGSAAPEAKDVTWTWDDTSKSYKATWSVGTLDKYGTAGDEKTLTYTYTVRDADKGKEITNRVVAKSGNTEDEEKTTVTVYNPNMTVTKAVTKVNDTAVASGETVVVQEGDVLTYTITVKNTGDQDLTNVVVTDIFTGSAAPTTTTANVTWNQDAQTGKYKATWSVGTLAKNNVQALTYTYTVTDDDVEVGTVTNNATVTSNEIPGGKSDETETAVVGDVIVQPADITIYTGGAGYTGTVDGTGAPATTNNGLPEPGFYITLPAALDTALKDAVGHNGEGPLDLSGYVTFTATTTDGESRKWELKRYDDKSGNTSIYDGKYIYRLVPANDQQPVRMQFTKDGTTVTSDEFSINLDALYEEYGMDIYAGPVNTATVEIHIAINSKTYSYTATSTPGTLTVRGVVNKENTTTKIVGLDQLPTTGEEIVAAASTDAEKLTYIINDSELSELEVSDPTKVELLVDDIVDAGKTKLKEYVLNNLDKVESLKSLQDDVDSNSKFEFRYLDLVDTSNGNVWICPSKDMTMTIFWPYPEDADINGNFYVLHFDELDRNYNDLDVVLSNNAPEVLAATKVEGGITFEVDSFSPFALIYDATVTLSYDANGGQGTMESTTVNVGDSTQVASNGFHRSGYRFIGWNTQKNGNGTSYKAGDTITLDASVTLYAQWKKNTETISKYYTLRYDSNGGTKYNDERYSEYTIVNLNKVPLREGYTFTGWYADEDLTQPITKIVMNSDKTVYAGWRKTTVPDGLNGDDHFAYVIGYNDGTVRPLAHIARSEVAAIFFRLLDPEVREENLTDVNPFTDVNTNDWFSKAVSTLYQLDIFKGRTATTFAPNAHITRAEFAVICARFDTGIYDGNANFNDIEGHWAEKEIKRAAALGWIMGAPDGNFYPDRLITRAEAMTMINRVLNRIPEDESDLLEGMNVWPDNPTNAWYYLAVQEATNTHDYVEKGEIYETWTKLLPDPDWTQYQ